MKHRARTAMPRRAVKRARQRGLAAIEFALTFTFLFLILYGLATFGAVFYTQQIVSRAAEDGVRAITAYRPTGTGTGTNTLFESTVRTAIVDSLEQSLVVPLTASANRRNWITQRVTIAITGNGATGIGSSTQIAVTVTYPYNGDSRLLPSLPLLDTSRWMPEQLRGRASAALLAM
jgi:Flp pilus assembly protein TadG